MSTTDTVMGMVEYHREHIDRELALRAFGEEAGPRYLATVDAITVTSPQPGTVLVAMPDTINGAVWSHLALAFAQTVGPMFEATVTEVSSGQVEIKFEEQRD